MSLFQQQRDNVRSTIIDTAISLFIKMGYSNVKIDDITKEVGIAKGTFYNYFSSKSEILMIWADRKFKQIENNQPKKENKCIQINLHNFIEMYAAAFLQEQSIFLSMIEEYIPFHYEEGSKEIFDFKKILFRVISDSKDFASIGNSFMDMKLRMLSRAILLETLTWIHSDNKEETLEIRLNNICNICLQGILCDIKAERQFDEK